VLPQKRYESVVETFGTYAVISIPFEDTIVRVVNFQQGIGESVVEKIAETF